MPTSIHQIRDLVSDLMKRRGVIRAGVFGSVARGQDTEGSDIDFLVEFEQGRSLLDLAGLRIELAEALSRDVDIATPGSLHPMMREVVLKELVPLI
jgi:uncharacterized protein